MDTPQNIANNVYLPCETRSEAILSPLCGKGEISTRPALSSLSLECLNDFVREAPYPREAFSIQVNEIYCPVEMIGECERGRRLPALCAWLVAKSAGPKTEVTAANKKHVKVWVERGWATTDGEYAWHKSFDTLGYKSKAAKVRVPRELLADKRLWKHVAIYALISYGTRTHPEGSLTQQASNSRRGHQPKGSVHLNGIALSILMRHTGRSKAQCSKSRTALSRLGLIRLERRWIASAEDDPLSFKTHDGWAREITSLSLPVDARFSWMRRGLKIQEKVRFYMSDYF